MKRFDEIVRPENEKIERPVFQPDPIDKYIPSARELKLQLDNWLSKQCSEISERETSGSPEITMKPVKLKDGTLVEFPAKNPAKDMEAHGNPDEYIQYAGKLDDEKNRRTENKAEEDMDAPHIKGAHEEVVDGVKHYYDDNGNEYRVGENLKPNCIYEINGYTYKTDGQGRIISASGKLHMKEHEGRLPIRDSIEDIGKGDQQDGDDRGHLIGDQFDGANGLENMIPQDADINRNDFRKLENELAKEVRAGKDVFVEVTPIYEGDSRRPSGVMVTYTIDGKTSTVFFPNGRE